MWFNGGMMNGGMMGAFGGVGIVMFIVQLLFWGAIIYLIFTAIKKINLKDDRKSKDSGIQILKERYAKGEISEDEYKKMKDILND